MKIKNYEKQSGILILSFIILFLEIIFSIVLFINKEYHYQKMTGIITKENIVTVLTTKKEKKILYKNKFLYLKDNKIKYKIVEDTSIPEIEEKNNYYEIKIKIKLKNNFKINKQILFSIKTKKYRLIKMFDVITGW